MSGLHFRYGTATCRSALNSHLRYGISEDRGLPSLLGDRRFGCLARSGNLHLQPSSHHSKLNPSYSRTLRRGKHRLLLWLGVEADGSIESTTPSKLASQDEMGRLERVRNLRVFQKNVCETDTLTISL